MRNRYLFSLLIILSAALNSFAQTVPQGFSYQCVVRDNTGTVIKNQTINMLFSIRSGSPNGPVSFSEKQTVSTNEFGLVSLVIGQGTLLQGDFNSINWGGGAKFLTVSVESSPNVYDELGSTQLMSVPYALYAQNVANGGGGGNGDNWGSQSAVTNSTITGNGTGGNPLGLAQQGAQSGQVLKWNGSTWTPADDITSNGMTYGTVSQINTGAGLQGGPITTSGTIGLANTGVTPGIYGSTSQIPVITIDAQGRITSAFTTVVSPGTVGINAGAGIAVQQNGYNFTITNTGDTNPNDDITTSSQSGGDVSGPFSNLQLKPNVVGTSELADNAVTTGKIADGAVDSGKIADGAVGTTQLAGNAVTTAKIASGAVTAAKLDNMGATSGQILKWNGSAWAPAVDQTGSINLTGGTGITITGTSPNFTITNSGDTNPNDDLTTSSIANGDITGPFSNLQIKPDVITTTELANNAVVTANLANGAVTAAKLDDMGAANGNVLKWNGSAWAPATDLTGSFNVIAGPGINVTPSGNSFIVENTGDLNPLDDITTSSVAGGDVTGTFDNLQLKPAVVGNTELKTNAVGTTNLITGSVTGDKINSMGAGIGQVLKYDGSTWAPGDDNTGGGGSGDNWGSQVVVSGPTLSGNGTAGNPLNLAHQSATTGQVLKWNGISWAPGNDGGDNWGSQAAKTTLVLAGDGTVANPLTIAQQAAAAGQVLKWNGSAWAPANDLTGSGSGNNYTAGSGISITGSAPNLVINNTGDLSNTNELQTLSLNGNQISLSNGGGTVTLPPSNTYTAGPGISITGSAPNLTITNSGDLSNTNELQTLSLNGATLTISGTNSSVDLSGLSGGSGNNWQLSGSNIFNTNTGSVLIGTNTGTSGKLEVVNTGSGEAGKFVASDATTTSSALYAQNAGTGAAGYFNSDGGPAIVTGTGKVGIHTDVPAFQLDVKGDGHFVNAGTAVSLTVENSGADFSQIGIKNNAIGSWLNMAKGGGNAAEYGIEYGKGSGTNLRVFTAKGDGNVVIGSPLPSTGQIHLNHGDSGVFMQNNNNTHFWEFWVTNLNGSLALYNDQFGTATPVGLFGLNGVYSPSDRRLKKDIAGLENGTLEKVLKMEPVSYRYTVEKSSDSPSLGFIAQDVQKLFPELVGQSPDRNGKGSYLNLNYSGIGVVAVKAIQEQQEQIESLKAQNEKLNKQLESLEQRLQKLESRMK